MMSSVVVDPDNVESGHNYMWTCENGIVFSMSEPFRPRENASRTSLVRPSLNDIMRESTANFIAGLRLSSAELAKLDPADRSCAVCLHPFRATDDKEDQADSSSAPESDHAEAAVRLACGHVIGEACLLEWLAQKFQRYPDRGTQTCPHCRQDIHLPSYIDAQWAHENPEVFQIALEDFFRQNPRSLRSALQDLYRSSLLALNNFGLP